MAATAPAQDLDTDLLGALDFAANLPCEGKFHGRGMYGHRAAESAAYFMIAPCCGSKIMVCEPRVAFMLTRGTLTCLRCMKESIVERYRFLPIGDHDAC